MESGSLSGTEMAARRRTKGIKYTDTTTELATEAVKWYKTKGSTDTCRG